MLARTFRKGWLRGLTALALVGLAVGIPVAATAQQRPPRPPGPPPIVLPPRPAPAIDRETLDRARPLIEKAERPEVELAPGLVVNIRKGPATRGMTVEVAGKPLSLPNDAELDGVVLFEEVWTPGAPKFPVPAYLIVRGNGYAGVSIATGKYHVVKGCLEMFQFLVDQLGADKLWAPAERCPPQKP